MLGLSSSYGAAAEEPMERWSVSVLDQMTLMTEVETRNHADERISLCTDTVQVK